MKRLISLVLCAALALSLAGCGSTTLNSFTWFVDAIPSNLDPQVASGSADVIACTHLYSGLFRLAADGTPQKDLCTDYTVSDGGLTYTFTLESGAVYRAPSGVSAAYTVTAGDFVFAFRRIFRTQTASPYASSFAGIANSAAVLAGTADESTLGVSAPDDTTLVIRLSAPDENFLEKLTLPGAMPCNQAFFDSTQGTYGLAQNAVLSNGPFYLYNWTDSGLFLRRDASGSAINNLRLVQNTSPAGQTPASLVENDKCSAILDTGSDDTSLTAIPYTDTTWSLVFQCGSVFGNASLRQALAAGAAETALPADDTLYAAADGIVPAGARVDGADYRSAAGSGLSSAGSGADAYASGLSAVSADALKGLSILVPESLDSAYVQALNGRWQEDYNLFFSVETVDDETFAKRYAAGDYTIALAPLTLTQSDPLALLQGLVGGAATANTDPAAVSLLNTAAQASGTARLQAEADAERQLTSTFAVVPLFAQEKRLLVNPAVTGLRFDPFGPIIDVTGASLSA
jgi:hypothetical protein